jgi:LuxR family maltose regulon positive regulatory protein
MARLLAEAAERGLTSAYLRTVLETFSPERRNVGTSPLPPPHPLQEPLTPREMEVLHLIAQGCSNQEISDHLCLALDTVKGYNRQIFGKLHVRRRTEAVARAHVWGLL